jgi:uncharacterized membrane protein
VSSRRKIWLTRAIAVILLAAIMSTGYLAMNPGLTTAAHSEFFIEPTESQTNATTTASYPDRLQPNATTNVTLGIGNHEHQSLSYRITVVWNETTTQSHQLRLVDNETRLYPIQLEAPSEPARYRVQFQLYKQNETEPALQTRLWIRVQE